MAELILPQNKDRDTIEQFKEILFGGITRKNINEEKAFILTSPDGNQYRLVVDNDGNLDTEEV